MTRAIFDPYQASGTCAGICICNRTHQIAEKTDSRGMRYNTFFRVYPQIQLA